jgi:hypothetical protein
MLHQQTYRATPQPSAEPTSLAGTIVSRLTWKRALLGVLLAVLAIAAVKATQWLAFVRGVQGYLYGYPLVTSDITRSVLTAPGVKERVGTGPLNRFTHVREFPDHTFRDVVAPNADTLYSIAWMDLSAGPLILHQPDMGQRYVLFGLLDAWSNSRSIGTRLYGQGPVDYAIVGPGWHGELPAGVKRIDVPTQMAWFIVRTGTAGKADYAAVHAVQDQYALVPLAQHGKARHDGAPDEVRPAADRGIDLVTPVVTQVAKMDAARYFDRMARLMAANPPVAADAPMVETLAKIGVVPGKPFDPAQLGDAQRRGLDDAVWFVRALFESRAEGTQADPERSGLQRWFFAKVTALMNDRLLNVRNGWTVPLNLGDYGTRYPLRAIVTLLGFGANPPADAVYPRTSVDAQGEALDGSRRYVLHFDKSQIPPAKAFWSLTMYDDASFFVDNPIQRYAIGDRDALKFNADGSLDLVVQHDAPADTSNWLPAPAGRFALMLRLYSPTADVLEGRWVPPAVTKQ